MEQMQHNDRLRSYRIQHNWRLQDLADLLDTSVSTVQRWERGRQQPGPYYRTKLCDLFGLSAQELGLVEAFPVEAEEVPSSAPTPSDPPEKIVLWTVPHLRNPHFTGREDLFARLTEGFALAQLAPMPQGSSPILTRMLALTGLGGIGKTQIAIEYAYRSYEQKRYAHTLWIAAANEETILASFLAVASQLPEVSLSDEQDQKQRVAAVLRWLEHAPDPWLLIYDNIDDLALVQRYQPRQGPGSLLLTTRVSAVASLATPVEVENLPLADGTLLLLRRSQRFASVPNDEMEQARQIVSALASFPLALDQAGAYIEETGCSFTTYLQLTEKHRQTLLARRGTQATNYPESVATTWSFALQKLSQIDLATVQLLRLCSFMAPDSIPEDLLIEGTAFWPQELQQAVADPLAFNQLVQYLLTFSLVKRLSSAKALSMHRLVQVVNIEQLDAREQRRYAEMVVRAVSTVFPENAREISTWPRCRLFLEQVQACASLIEKYHLYFPEAATLLHQAGAYLREQSSYHTARPLYQLAIQIREEVLGVQHPQTASSINSLGALYWLEGNFQQAEVLLQRALQIQEDQSDPYHSGTALSMHNLAGLYATQGKYEQAETLFQRALAVYEHLGLVREAHMICTCSMNLGLLSHRRGDLEQTEKYFWQTLTTWEIRLLPEQANSSEAQTQRPIPQSQPARSEELFKRTIALKKFGAEHIYLNLFFTTVASLLAAQEHFAWAETLFHCTRTILEQQLGPEDDNVLTLLQEMAIMYGNQQKYELASSLFRRVIAVYESRYPSPYYLTAEAQHEFALLRQAQGNDEEARALFEAALSARLQIFGPTNNLTMETRERLATLTGSSL